MGNDLKNPSSLTKECDWEVQKAKDIADRAREEQNKQNGASSISNLLLIGLILSLVSTLSRYL